MAKYIIEDSGENLGKVGVDAGYMNLQVGDIVSTSVGKNRNSFNLIVNIEGTFTAFGWGYDSLSSLHENYNLKLVKKFDDYLEEDYPTVFQWLKIEENIEEEVKGMSKLQNLRDLIISYNLSDEELDDLTDKVIDLYEHKDRLTISDTHKDSLIIESANDSYYDCKKELNKPPFIISILKSGETLDECDHAVELTLKQAIEFNKHLTEKINYLKGN